MPEIVFRTQFPYVLGCAAPALLLIATFSGCSSTPTGLTVQATAETTPVASLDDAADDLIAAGTYESQAPEETEASAVTHDLIEIPPDQEPAGEL